MVYTEYLVHVDSIKVHISEVSWDAITVLVTGSNGLVGGGIARRLRALGANVISPTRDELDLLDSDATNRFFAKHSPQIVFGAAALVGGIQANINNPVRFLVENLQIQTNQMMASADNDVKRFVLLGSSCIYPRNCEQPMKESSYMTGALEPTNESYAIAKIAGIQLGRSLMQEGKLDVVVPIPSNIYGPGDTFDLERAHVLSALVRRCVDARDDGRKEIEIWGTGDARRELTHVDDVADAVILIAGLERPPFLINVGTGIDHSIKELVQLVADIVGYKGRIVFDPNRPDGMPRKVVDTSYLRNLGWTANVTIMEGIIEVVAEYETKKVSNPKANG